MDENVILKFNYSECDNVLSGSAAGSRSSFCPCKRFEEGLKHYTKKAGHQILPRYLPT